MAGDNFPDGCEFDLATYIAQNHLMCGIDRFLDLRELNADLRGSYSHAGRPLIDAELIIRMLVIGYAMVIRSERRPCQKVHLNLADRWFCRLGLEGKIPDLSTFSKLRHGKFLRATFSAACSRTWSPRGSSMSTGTVVRPAQGRLPCGLRSPARRRASAGRSNPSFRHNRCRPSGPEHRAFHGRNSRWRDR